MQRERWDARLKDVEQPGESRPLRSERRLRETRPVRIASEMYLVAAYPGSGHAWRHVGVTCMMPLCMGVPIEPGAVRAVGPVLHPGSWRSCTFSSAFTSRPSTSAIPSTSSTPGGARSPCPRSRSVTALWRGGTPHGCPARSLADVIGTHKTLPARQVGAFMHVLERPSSRA